MLGERGRQEGGRPPRQAGGREEGSRGRQAGREEAAAGRKAGGHSRLWRK